jgi:acyl carrier protein
VKPAEIMEQLRTVLVEEFEVPAESVTPEADLYEELGLDSIDAVDLAVKVQQMTGKRIKPEDFKHVRKVEDVVQAAMRLIDD